MLLNELSSQAFALRVLRTHYEKKRLAHAYLLSGGGRQDKESLAAFFSLMVNGGGGLPEEADEGALRRIWEEGHPDVRWLGRDEKERSIKIEQVREIIHWAALKPYEGTRKVFIISGAERLTIEAQNALLKILEEPPAQTCFCLLVETKDPLLDTIRSRAFEVRLKPCLEKEEAVLPEGFGKKRWEEFFEDYQASAREELNETLNQLMIHFSGLLEKASRKRQPLFFSAWLEAVDLLYETKDAIAANANQKLALTRLAMRMKRVLPDPKMLEVN